MSGIPFKGETPGGQARRTASPPTSVRLGFRFDVARLRYMPRLIRARKVCTRGHRWTGVSSSVFPTFLSGDLQVSIHTFDRIARTLAHIWCSERPQR